MNLSKSLTCAALAMTLASNGAFANPALPAAHAAGYTADFTGGSTAAFSDAFTSDVSQDLVALDDAAMAETRGELIPLIASIAAVDLALATFFWGVYVPMYAQPRGGVCTTCDIPKPLPR